MLRRITSSQVMIHLKHLIKPEFRYVHFSPSHIMLSSVMRFVEMP